jgi:hypothetical protein
MEGVENAAHTSTAFPTPPTATAAAASIRKTHRFCRGGHFFGRLARDHVFETKLWHGFGEHARLLLDLFFDTV